MTDDEHTEPTPRSPGERRLGRYVLERQLGAGGMAEIFLARQDGIAGFSKRVVVKRILPLLGMDPRFVDMFLSEARLSARLQHANVVQVFELGADQGRYFIAMEHIEGVDLQRAAIAVWARGESLPMEVVLGAVADAALGLHHAHALTDDAGRPTPLVHRDVSPDNLIIGKDGVTKVVDFGVARVFDPERLTQTTELKGKIPFMSPEQIEGRPLDGRSDLWSLGVTLHWLLTGERPFLATSPVALVDAILRAPAPPPSARNPLVPKKVDAIVAKLLARDRDARFPTGRAVHDAIAKVLHGAGSVTDVADFVAAVTKAGVGAREGPLRAPASAWMSADDVPTLLDEPTVSQVADPPSASLPRSPAPRPSAHAAARPQAQTLVAPARAPTRPMLLVVVAVAAAVISGAVAAWVVKPHPAAPALTTTTTTTHPAPTTPAAPMTPPAPATPAATTTPAATKAPAAPAMPPAPTTTPGPASTRGAARPAAPALLTRTLDVVAPKDVGWQLAPEGPLIGLGTATLTIPAGAQTIFAVDLVTGGSVRVAAPAGSALAWSDLPQGTVRITAQPWARVRIGRLDFGPTPVTLALPAGTYQLVVERDGVTDARRLELAPGSNPAQVFDRRDAGGR